MLNFFKFDYYKVGELIEVLQKAPKDYTIEVYGDTLDTTSGSVNDIDIDHEKKRVCLWFD